MIEELGQYDECPYEYSYEYSSKAEEVKDKFILYVVDKVSSVKTDILSRYEIQRTMNDILNEYGKMLERF